MTRFAAFSAALFLALALFAPAADAATISVTIDNFAFGPNAPLVAQGNAVKWTNSDITTHTSTSNQNFWHSPDLAPGQTFSATFWNAGTFGYHCRFHPDMTASVRVPIKASGSSSQGWTLRWSSLSSTPTSRSFDVQIKRPGSTAFVAWRTNVKGRSAFFNPLTNGTYAFRARTDNLSNGTSSGWSPTKTVSIT
jgi:plastocyanin